MFKFVKSSFTKVKDGLQKTRALLQSKIHDLFQGKIDEEALDKLEQILYEADLGVPTATHLVSVIREHIKQHPKSSQQELMALLHQSLVKALGAPTDTEEESLEGPTVILVVGINGSGKTTSVAKLAKKYQNAGKKVLLAAADTFRAAAIEQLQLWATKLEIDLIKSQFKSDPSSVVFDAITAAIARKYDIVIIDTAGRLHVKTDLMQELQKMRRSAAKALPGAPHETLIVLDATLGQNALHQAQVFHKFTPMTGIVLTKLDGTTKGGIVVAIQKELGIPVKWIGVGESAEDLQPFDAETFVTALLDN